MRAVAGTPAARRLGDADVCVVRGLAAGLCPACVPAVQATRCRWQRHRHGEGLVQQVGTRTPQTHVLSCIACLASVPHTQRLHMFHPSFRAEAFLLPFFFLFFWPPRPTCSASSTSSARSLKRTAAAAMRTTRPEGVGVGAGVGVGTVTVWAWVWISGCARMRSGVDLQNNY